MKVTFQQMEANRDSSERLHGVPVNAGRISFRVLEPERDCPGRCGERSHHAHAVLQLETLHAHWT